MDFNTNALRREYLTQSIMTASPGELILMLYDACIKNIKLAQIALENTPNYDKANTCLIKAQKIIGELVSSLDSGFELSNQLLPIYEYVLYRLRTMNITKDMSEVADVIEILNSLRDTWEQIAKPQTSGGSEVICG